MLSLTFPVPPQSIEKYRIFLHCLIPLIHKTQHHKIFPYPIRPHNYIVFFQHRKYWVWVFLAPICVLKKIMKASAKVYLYSYQTSMMERFMEINSSFQQLTIFTKNSLTDNQGSLHNIFNGITNCCEKILFPVHFAE